MRLLGLNIFNKAAAPVELEMKNASEMNPTGGSTSVEEAVARAIKEEKSKKADTSDRDAIAAVTSGLFMEIDDEVAKVAEQAQVRTPVDSDAESISDFEAACVAI